VGSWGGFVGLSNGQRMIVPVIIVSEALTVAKCKQHEMNMRMIGRFVVADPTICPGQPTFRGTRILLADVLEQGALLEKRSLRSGVAMFLPTPLPRQFDWLARRSATIPPSTSHPNTCSNELRLDHPRREHPRRANVCFWSAGNRDQRGDALACQSNDIPNAIAKRSSSRSG
jgi:hypothetical protein